MKKVGITGGIGCGKSLVCEVFKTLHIPVYHADAEARRLMETCGALRGRLTALFGPSVYTDAGLDRKRLAALLFADKRQVERVNQLVHPAVMQDFEIWAARQEAPYVLHEAAILFETGLYKLMDVNILVRAPREVRIARVMARDATTRSAVLQRMQHQGDEASQTPLADFIIDNDNTQLIVPQVLQIHAQLKGEL